jgi:glycosyltransferase involved in cell wall biosynthesis
LRPATSSSALSPAIEISGGRNTVPTPGVSVVMPLFNKEPYVRRAIESVLAQTFQDFEIVVVNDGSTDGGSDVVRQIADPRIRRIDQENAGVSAARNRGIHEARSGLIAFLDADDEWLPEFLATILKLRARFPQAGAYATAYRIAKGDGVHRDVIASGFAPGGHMGLLKDYFRSAHKAPISSSSVAVPRGLFERLGGFREGYAMGEDMDMWLRIAAHYDIAYCAKVAAIWRYALQNSACQTRLPEEKSPLSESLRGIEASREVPAEVKRRARAFWTRLIRRDARKFCLGGRKDIAWQLLRETDCRTAPFGTAYTILFVVLPVPLLVGGARLWGLAVRMILRSRQVVLRSLARV